MRRRRPCVAFLIGLLVGPWTGMIARADVDTGVIRLDAPEGRESGPTAARRLPSPPVLEGRRGFDYDEFRRRLESLWFQRKAFLADGRSADAARQSQLIRDFCSEEGVRHLESLTGALVAESHRQLAEGSYESALGSLDLAERFAAENAQVHFGRAAVFWRSGESYLEAAKQFLAGMQAAIVQAWEGLSLLNHVAVVAVLALLGSVVVFSAVMAFKYQAAFRHEVEEWMGRHGARQWGSAAGWALLFLPFLTWIFAGWIALYWIVISFRFMRRGEKLATIVLLIATTLSVPAFRVSVALYGMLTDPAVRTTLDSHSGAYSPDRVVRLKELVESHPEDPVFRFLLAGLYKEGRYLEEAYAQYRQVLELDPNNAAARINIGNIYFLLGQHAEAIAEYGKAAEIRPDSLLAFYNMYLAQSESFRFKEAEASLKRAQIIDPERASRLLASTNRKGERAMVLDASVRIGSVWRAALEGRPLRETLQTDATDGVWKPLPRQFLNFVSIAALAAMLACASMLVAAGNRPPARRCIRCGRPFCHRCRSGREGKEYCSQCLHLFVIGDGLAPETKTRKLYEVDRYERFSRRGRKILSLVLPGSAQLLRGRAGPGCLLVFLWLLTVVVWQPVVLLPAERLTGAGLHLDLLRPGAVPAAFGLDPSATIAFLGVVAVWVAGNMWRLRRLEA